MNNTNWLAVLVAAISAFLIGFLWYGVLFQSQWMAGNGITMNAEETIMYKYGTEVSMSMMPMIANIIGMIILAIIMNWLINKTNSTTLTKGATLGLIIGLVASINILLSNLFANNSMTLTLVDSSYIIAVLAVMGLILGAWRKS